MPKQIIPVKAISHTLRDARKKAGLTQAGLGKLLALPQAHISAMESGKIDVRASTLLAWARAVGCELLVVPRSLVSSIRHLERGPSEASSSLYETTELDDDSDVADITP